MKWLLNFLILFTIVLSPSFGRAKTKDSWSDAEIQRVIHLIQIGIEREPLLSVPEKSPTNLKRDLHYWNAVGNVGKDKVVLPKDAKTYIGLAATIPKSAFEIPPPQKPTGNWREDIANAALNDIFIGSPVNFNRRLVMLTLGSKKIRVADLKWDNEKEKQELECLAEGVEKDFYHPSSDAFFVSGALKSFLDAESDSQDRHFLTLKKYWADYANQYGVNSRLYYLAETSWGPSYVVLEKAVDGGVFINLFPLRDYAEASESDIMKKCQNL